MGRLFPLLALADLALIVVALIDCLSVEEFQIRALPRVAWVFLILLFSPIGPIAWFVAGRPQRDAAGAAAGCPDGHAPLPPGDDFPVPWRGGARRHGGQAEALPLGGAPRNTGGAMK